MKTNRIFNGKPGLIGELKKRDLFAQKAREHVEEDIAFNEEDIVRESKPFAKRALTTAGFTVANVVVNGLGVLTDSKFFDFLSDVNNLAHLNSDVISKLNEVCPVSILGAAAVTAGLFATYSALKTYDFNHNIDTDNQNIKDLNTYSALCGKAAQNVNEGYISHRATVNESLNITLQNPTFDENGGISKIAPIDFRPAAVEEVIKENITPEEFTEIDEGVNKMIDDALRKHHYYQNTSANNYTQSTDK